MAIPPNIRDQAYKLFVQDAPDLLRTIEVNLLSLKQERTPAKIHTLMRTAHTIKGGAASVGLDGIATLAHRLENIFKALYSEELEINTALESQLLQAYDCLRFPLMQQVVTGQFDTQQAFASAETVFKRIEDQLGEILARVDQYDIPTSAQLGVDMALSILEVDVSEKLEQLAEVVGRGQDYEVEAELRSLTELFIELAEILNKPGLGVIARAVQTAVNAHPNQVLQIALTALVDLRIYREALLTSKGAREIGPSDVLLKLAEPTTREPSRDRDYSIQPFNGSTVNHDSYQSFGSSTVSHELAQPFGSSIFSHEPAQQEIDRQPFELINPTVVDEELLDVETFDIRGVSLFEEELEEFLEVSIDEESLEELLGNRAVTTLTTHTSSANPRSPAAPTIREFQPPNLDENLDEIKSDDHSMLPNVFPEVFPDVIARSPDTPDRTSSTLAISSSNLRFLSAAEPPQPSVDKKIPQTAIPVVPGTTVRVDSNQLEWMSNLVDEAVIKRSALSLQSEQAQKSIRGMLNRCGAIEQLVSQLRKAADQTLVPDPKPNNAEGLAASSNSADSFNVSSSFRLTPLPAEFDALEMDSYGTLHSLLQRMLEDMIQLKESADDIALFSRRSDKDLSELRKILTHLQDDFMWVRMLPLDEVISRFPRILRDLSIAHNKPVELSLNGTGVMLDKAVLEKIYDPLLHLLRNAFDHGIEPPEIRRRLGKPEQGLIEINAYHRGGQTVIEVRDDGRGLQLEHIRRRAVELGMVAPQQLVNIPDDRLLDFIFEPGFSTAQQVSELSGRGVGLDVVRTQLHLLKGTVSVTSNPKVGTTFTLRLPLTLTSEKLLVCLIGCTALALPSGNIREIVTPKANQVIHNQEQRFLDWRTHVVPIYRLANLLEYACPVPDVPSLNTWGIESSATDSTPPLLVVDWGQQAVALEIDQLITEQKLVIKPFGSAIAPPICAYGCTILGDGSLVPVVDSAALLSYAFSRNTRVSRLPMLSPSGRGGVRNRYTVTNPSLPPSNVTTLLRTSAVPKVLIVDDAVALRQTLVTTLEKAGYRVLQAGDGWEAIKQLQRSPDIKLVISDIEMPNMNGFDFMNYRRQEPHFQNIPVVILTSRSNEKHRKLAIHLGAVSYFTKPYIEQDFLNAIKDILEHYAINH
ncbi:MAG: hybrid sensor histidine kinase/response regulator [Cyanobacteria bacterium CRU_2_1]|nr:hybrid sensor histidine kinase/response regulator [Cyanobacteria bacterium CRU_2_1]